MLFSMQESDGKKHVNIALKRQHEKTKNQVCHTQVSHLTQQACMPSV